MLTIYCIESIVTWRGAPLGICHVDYIHCVLLSLTNDTLLDEKSVLLESNFREISSNMIPLYSTRGVASNKLVHKLGSISVAERSLFVHAIYSLADPYCWQCWSAEE